ncbi:hypothetical protein SPRG_21590 [Saprolegnia parasitica CBS 223.65]|uniref:Uncharacterized protein n=1 Tax=Saprolegnia parasitica (strain CBS 223.65) TaxID=695850 RepID=A0A067BWV5_SAPPC|nr:hypothetical protein SPRG_21590 [Saprolegnia parasitica CBS 223.65]KDO18771.1 hypothetical protein SPRG_21590 [Saprolegnia parasitica CBS 223.65]|eukprot:XP_012210517.1 hypothetical protein SPRG_21590 [Saprolegnia parasitica CBS 223.65]
MVPSPRIKLERGLDERFAYDDNENSNMETLLAAPVLADTTLAGLAAFGDARARYEVACEAKACVQTRQSILATIAPPTLRFLAQYKMCMAEAAITDADILAWIERELAETTPSSIEAVVQHCRVHLVMDMRIPDARARVARYFMRANEMATNFHFAGVNLFCAMLVEGVRPRALRRDVELLLHVPSNAHAKCDDRRLFDLVESCAIAHEARFPWRRRRRRNVPGRSVQLLRTADDAAWRSPDVRFL